MDENIYLERFKTLTERQKEVLSYVCQGMTYKEVGERLIISKATVTSHMVHIYQKLGLEYLNKTQRAATLFEHYCPLLRENPPVVIVGEEEDEDENMEPVPPEVQRMVEEDESALVVWKPTPVVEVIPPQVAPRRRGLGCLWLFVGIILGMGLLGGGLYFTRQLPVFIGNAQPTYTIEEIDVPSNTPEATQTAYVIVITATSPPFTITPTLTDTLPPTDTLQPTETPTPSFTPSPTPEPDTAAGSVLEVGEWWQEDGVWLRVSDFRVDVQSSIWIDLEIWNKTGQTLMFSWHPSGNFSLVDNTGHSYPLYFTFEGGTTMNTIFEVDELDRVDFHQYDTSLHYQDDYIFNSNVTELILTVMNFSRIDQAQFRIEVNK